MKVAPIAKATVPVVLGVLGAGLIMYFGARNGIGILEQARAGFDA